MTVTIPIQAIELAPGSQITVHNLSWRDFEGLMVDLGEKRRIRIAYYRGTLEIISPLALHERFHRIIAYNITTILEIQGRNWEDFGSTTFKYPDIAGIEPDTCFYIQNANQVKGCTQMDLSIYPPPDLVIESDVTSKTAIEAYIALGVPEIWIYSKHQLNIYILQGSSYVQSDISSTFPDLLIKELIPQLVQKAIDHGTSRMLGQLRILLSERKQGTLSQGSGILMRFAVRSS